MKTIVGFASHANIARIMQRIDQYSTIVAYEIIRREARKRYPNARDHRLELAPDNSGFNICITLN